MIWFTADTHFGHFNIMAACARPWSDVNRMNNDLVAAINDRVAPDDDLYVLGDFSFKTTVDAARRLRERIACRRVHLVPGNHDKDWTQPEVAGTFIVEPLICMLTCEVTGESSALTGSEQPTPRLRKQRLVLCHYPIMDWPHLRHGSIHLHGHIHAPAAYNEDNRERHVLRYDVGVDANGYAPVSLDDVLAFFDGVQPAPRFKRGRWESDGGEGSVPHPAGVTGGQRVAHQ